MSAGIHSSTTAKAPACSAACASAQQLGRVALHPVPAHLVHCLRTQSHVSHHRYAGSHQGRNRLSLLRPSFKLHTLAAALLQNACGVGNRGTSRNLEAGKRHVHHHQRSLYSTPNDFGVVDHFVERDVQRVLVALDDHGETVSHQDRIDSRFVEQRRQGEVISCQHADLASFGLEGHESRDRHSLRLGGHLHSSRVDRDQDRYGLRIVTVAGGRDNLPKSRLPAVSCGNVVPHGVSFRRQCRYGQPVWNSPPCTQYAWAVSARRPHGLRYPCLEDSPNAAGPDRRGDGKPGNAWLF